VGFGRDVVYGFTIIDVDINTHVEPVFLIYLRGRGSNPLGACFFNLILVRRGMHVGMRMGFVGGGMRKTRDSRE
jgi:hypothetical protein